MAKIYYEQDADLNVLKGKTVGIIGYGNQGRNQALNLKDSGIKVVIGERAEKPIQQAKADGFEVTDAKESRPRRISSRSSPRMTCRPKFTRTTSKRT